MGASPLLKHRAAKQPRLCSYKRKGFAQQILSNIAAQLQYKLLLGLRPSADILVIVTAGQGPAVTKVNIICAANNGPYEKVTKNPMCNLFCSALRCS